MPEIVSNITAQSICYISLNLHMVIYSERFQVQGSGFKGYNRWILLPILIKIWHTLHLH